MKPSTGAPVRNRRNAVRDQLECLSAIDWNRCPRSLECCIHITQLIERHRRVPMLEEQGYKWRSLGSNRHTTAPSRQMESTPPSRNTTPSMMTNTPLVEASDRRGVQRTYLAK